VGVPAARGHGVMEVQTFEAAGGALGAAQRPEHEAILSSEAHAVDRTQGSFGPSTKVPLWIRAVFARGAAACAIRLNESGSLLD
jgi:hypothetical protein